MELYKNGDGDRILKIDSPFWNFHPNEKYGITFEKPFFPVISNVQVQFFTIYFFGSQIGFNFFLFFFKKQTVSNFFKIFTNVSKKLQNLLIYYKEILLVAAFKTILTVILYIRK